MAFALRFTCDAGCEAHVNVAYDYDGAAWSLADGVAGPGWIDGTFDLPDGWRYDAKGDLFLCPVHAAVIEVPGGRAGP